MIDKINRPPHYGGDLEDNPYETIKVIESCGWLEGYCKGAAMKYIMRAGKKEGETETDDLAKAEWYLRYWREYTK